MRRLGIGLAVAALVAAAALLSVAGSTEQHGTYRVDGIFASTTNLFPGQDVRVAGARVGTIEDIVLTEDYRARVQMRVEAGFAPFRADASCVIEPVSLIGEKYVDCFPGTPKAPVLRGKGDAAPTVPLARTRSSVDLDLIFGAFELPYRERFSLIINELGMGLVGRGRDLNTAIRQANPALQRARDVLRILARDRDRLGRLVDDSDTILARLAPRRRRLESTIQRARSVSETTAERRSDLDAAVRELPPLLEQSRPALADLEGLARDATPLLADLRRSARPVTRLLRDVPAFAAAGRPALRRVARATGSGRGTVVRARPVVSDLRRFARRALPVARLVDELLQSLRARGVVEGLQAFAYNGALSLSRFDAVSHILPSHVLVNNCGNYAHVPVAECLARFNPPPEAAATRSARNPARSKRRAPRRAALPRATPAPSATVQPPADTRPQLPSLDRVLDPVKEQLEKLLPGLGDALPTPPRTGRDDLLELLLG